jgi:SAM-dependent methyltransferase
MVLLVSVERVPDLLRVEAILPDGKLLMRGDADPERAVEAAAGDVLGRALSVPKEIGRGLRWLRRLWLELAEAMTGIPDEPGSTDPAETIRRKYDSQAPYYVQAGGDDISGRLLDRTRAAIPQGGRLLVVGSGSGRECFALRRAGYQVCGIDFSPAMIELARCGARERGLEIAFEQADIRTYRIDRGELSGIVFTYDVYSFLPGAADRIDLMRRMTGWLAPGGVIFLSARLAHGLYERLLLTVQWLRRGNLQTTSWGRSHTRYIAADGAMHRSFVHCFTSNRLRRELAAAGLLATAFDEGHFELRASARRERGKQFR